MMIAHKQGQSFSAMPPRAFNDAEYGGNGTDDVPDALPPTGQYPDDVWADVDYSALAEALMDGDDMHSGDDIPDALPPTGQYPDDVWADVDYSALAEALMDGDDMHGGDDVPDAMTPTGQYPDDVWAQVDYTIYAEPFTEADPVISPQMTSPDSQAGARGDTRGDAPSTNGPPAPVPAIGVALDNQEMIYIIRQVAEPRSGERRYMAVTPPTSDGEGLRYGLVQLRQESGDLGTLLTIMQRRDPSLFAVIFGPHVAELLHVTTAATSSQRLQPVGGSHLWEADWLERFSRAAEQTTFQAAQNEFAIENQFRPMLSAALSLGIRSDRGLAMMYELLLTFGLRDAVAWVKDVLNTAGEATQAGETTRLSHLIQASEGTLRTRLERLHNSPALDGTIYDTLPLVEATT